MALMKWDVKYELGVRKIDHDHRELVAILNRLHDAMLAGKGQQSAPTVLKQMVDYTVTHFTTEEALMEEYEYPWTIAHKREHANLIIKLTQHKREMEEGRLNASLNLLKFLREWWAGHILNSDRKLSRFLTENGVR